MNSKTLQNAALLGGAVYLFLVSAAHFFQIKVPVLFIYFDVPSNVYQDRIIAAVSFALAVFLLGCFRTRESSPGMIRYALRAGTGLALILAANNALAEDALRLNPVYWGGIAFVCVYVALPHYAFRSSRC